MAPHLWPAPHGYESCCRRSRTEAPRPHAPGLPRQGDSARPVRPRPAAGHATTRSRPSTRWPPSRPPPAPPPGWASLPRQGRRPCCPPRTARSPHRWRRTGARGPSEPHGRSRRTAAPHGPRPLGSRPLARRCRRRSGPPAHPPKLAGRTGPRQFLARPVPGLRALGRPPGQRRSQQRCRARVPCWAEACKGSTEIDVLARCHLAVHASLTRASCNRSLLDAG